MNVARDWPPARSALVLGVVGLTLAGATLACRPPATNGGPTAVGVDAYAVVRTTAEAAYRSGTTHLERGELEAALVDLDTARTNDADNRQDIQQALDLAIGRLAVQTPTLAPTTVPRIVVVATVPAASDTTPAAVGVGGVRGSGTATPLGAGGLLPVPGATSTVPGGTLPVPGGVSPMPGGVSPAAGGGDLVTWRDPRGRFSIGAPDDWVTDEHAAALFGVATGVVQFRDLTGQVELDVAVDSTASVASPELYSAGLEIALQQQAPGYAAEQMQPETSSGKPAMRRVFTFTRRDSTGQDIRARGFQLTVLNGSTPYVISGSGPAEHFAQDRSTLDRMVDSFRFT